MGKGIHIFGWWYRKIRGYILIGGKIPQFRLPGVEFVERVSHLVGAERYIAFRDEMRRLNSFTVNGFKCRYVDGKNIAIEGLEGMWESGCRK